MTCPRAAGASLTTSVDAVNLSSHVKITAVGPFLKLDASTLTVNSGSAINVQGGSLLKVTGDLLGLNNGALLKVLAGGALRVVGGSVVNVSGAFVAFGGSSGNSINITNSACSSTCSSSGGISFLATNGATVSILGTAIKNSSLGSFTLSSGQTAAIIADGASTKVTISGN